MAVTATLTPETTKHDAEYLRLRIAALEALAWMDWKFNGSGNFGQHDGILIARRLHSALGLDGESLDAALARALKEQEGSERT